MRWKTNPNYHKLKDKDIKPKAGDIRVKVKFLFIPRRFNGKTRWLEVSHMIERYEIQVSVKGGLPYIYKWIEIGFTTHY